MERGRGDVRRDGTGRGRFCLGFFGWPEKMRGIVMVLILLQKIIVGLAEINHEIRAESWNVG